MSIEQAIQISLVDFLASMGFHPTKVRGYKLWYLSPFRAESKPSFKVNVEMNLWYDFGEGVGGGIIPLAKRMFGTNDISVILSRIEAQPGVPVSSIPSRSPSYKRKEEPTMDNVQVQPLNHHALTAYLTKRGIQLEVAKSYCREVHYEIHGKRYFALAFLNNSGGYELRNPYFKGCMGRKDITILHDKEVDGLDTSCCHVFEGFFDFLSFRMLLTMGKLRLPSYGTTRYIILNSVNNLEKALREMTQVEHIFTYLDNDQAGRKATETILGLYAPRTTDFSFMFEGYNDLNDYLLNLKADVTKQQIHTITIDLTTRERHSVVECLTYKPKTMMNKLIPTRSLLTRKYTLVYLSSKPMEKETEVDDKSHKDKSDKLQDQDDSSKDY